MVEISFSFLLMIKLPGPLAGNNPPVPVSLVGDEHCHPLTTPKAVYSHWPLPLWS